MTIKTPTTPVARASRRQVLKSTAATAGLALGSGLIDGFPAIHAADPIVIRYAGTGVNAFRELSEKCKEDTGIEIQYTTLTSDDVVKRAVTQPSSFDLLDSEYWMLKKIVPSGNLRGMDISKIALYDNIVPIFTKGELPNGTKTSRIGIAPIKVSYLTGAESTEFSESPTDFMTLIPTVYNADTLGIRPDLIDRPIESWAELLNPEFKGRTSILNIPAIGIMDAGMVCQAMGEITYGDMGNMTKEEIDATMAVLTAAKKDGQFRALWKEFNESVNLMASGEVVIQSMWSPAVTKVRQQGIPCVYQPLQEGYRAWAAGLGIPTHVDGKMLDACYEFINWYLTGWAGAFLNRQGYYTAVLETAEAQMEPWEWSYWMLGEPAAKAVVSPTGEELAHRYGMERRLRKVRAAAIPVLALEEGPDAAAKVQAEILRAIEEDRAEAVILGCAGMADLAAALSERTGVTVIDGVGVAVKLIEAMVGLGLKTSKISGYAAPHPKPYAGDMAHHALEPAGRG